MKNGTLFAAMLASALLLTGCGSSTPAATEPATEAAPRVAKLILAHEADNVFYVEGEEFDTTGLVVNAKMSDGTTVENVPFEVKVASPLTRKTLYATLSYGGKTVSQQLRITLKGNDEQYSVANTAAVPSSPLEGKTIYWLGSSVTYGASACGESMADFIAKKDGAVCLKEAVSGTTLADVKAESYVQRFNSYLSSEDCADHLDAFVCQLSTNDRGTPELFGEITPDEVRDAASFDCATTFGAMEYLVATVKEVWDCPVFFYTNPPLDENYDRMVEGLEKLAEKWDISVIDLYHNETIGSMSEEENALYMADNVHPTRAGYRELWMPIFEDALKDI